MNFVENGNNFDFSKYTVKNPELSQNQIQNNSENQSDESFAFEKYKPTTKVQEIGRHAARTGARITETVLGFPGDLVKFTKYLGEKLPQPPAFLKKEPNFVQKAGKSILERLPSSQEIKDFTSYLTSGFTDPQSTREELGDDIVSLGTSLLIPSKDPIKFTSLLTALGKSITAKFASAGTKYLGGSEGTQKAVEFGTLFLMGLINPNTASKFVADQYSQSRSKIPPQTMLSTTNLEKSLSALEQDLAKGISTSTKNEVKSAVSELKAKASGGAMPAEEVVEAYHNINERLTSKKLFDELNTAERKTLKHRYDLFKDAVNKEISNYGTYNPEFYNQWKKANAAYSTIAGSKAVSNFLQSKLGNIPKHLTGTVALELFLGHPQIAAATVGAAGAVKVGELLYRIGKNPTLRKHYLNVIKEAGNENLPAVIKNLNSLHEESKDLD